MTKDKTNLSGRHAWLPGEGCVQVVAALELQGLSLAARSIAKLPIASSQAGGSQAIDLQRTVVDHECFTS